MDTHVDFKNSECGNFKILDSQWQVTALHQPMQMQLSYSVQNVNVVMEFQNTADLILRFCTLHIQTGREEHLQNELLCVEWDDKHIKSVNNA